MNFNCHLWEPFIIMNLPFSIVRLNTLGQAAFNAHASSNNEILCIA